MFCSIRFNLQQIQHQDKKAAKEEAKQEDKKEDKQVSVVVKDKQTANCMKVFPHDTSVE